MSDVEIEEWTPENKSFKEIGLHAWIVLTRYSKY